MFYTRNTSLTPINCRWLYSFITSAPRCAVWWSGCWPLRSTSKCLVDEETQAGSREMLAEQKSQDSQVHVFLQSHNKVCRREVVRSRKTDSDLRRRSRSRLRSVTCESSASPIWEHVRSRKRTSVAKDGVRGTVVPAEIIRSRNLRWVAEVAPGESQQVSRSQESVLSSEVTGFTPGAEVVLHLSAKLFTFRDRPRCAK
jgi:hypothetical protein